jgi:hypothetical protein
MNRKLRLASNSNGKLGKRCGRNPASGLLR